MPQRPKQQKIKKNLDEHNLAKILNRAHINRKFVYVFENGIIRLLLNEGNDFKYIHILEFPQGSYQGYQYKYDRTKPKRYGWIYSDKTQVEVREIRGQNQYGTMELFEEIGSIVSEKTMETVLFHINHI